MLQICNIIIVSGRANLCELKQSSFSSHSESLYCFLNIYLWDPPLRQLLLLFHYNYIDRKADPRQSFRIYWFTKQNHIQNCEAFCSNKIKLGAVSESNMKPEPSSSIIDTKQCWYLNRLWCRCGGAPWQSWVGFLRVIGLQRILAIYSGCLFEGA